MKKISFLLAAILLSSAFVLPAGAYPNLHAGEPYYINVQTEGINNGPEAQADMLNKLGLLRGTGKGPELKRPMTRVEAAALFVRFLGVEKTVLSGTWKHPFSDVPSWADQYIGWLWQNGLTEGVSATKYGAQQAVTIRQYAGLLARALLGQDAADDSWTYCATGDEAKLCDANGFFNRDAAVGLSVRALTLACKAAGRSSVSLAQFLISQGAFTAVQLGDASWGVLPSSYDTAAKEDGKSYMARYVAGVPVARCEEDGLSLVDGSEYKHDKVDYLFTSRIKPAGTVEFLVLDAKTLAVSALDGFRTDGNLSGLSYIGSVSEGPDCFAEECADKTGSFVGVGGILCWDGKSLSRAIARDELWLENEPSRINAANARDEGECRIESRQGQRQSFMSGDNLAIVGKDTLFCITRDGVHKNPYLEGTEFLAMSAEGTFVAQRVTEEKTVISCIDALTGTALDEYTAAHDMQGEEGQRTVSSEDDYRFFGEAGLYEFFDGRLYQLTDRPVLSAAATNEGTVILTHAPGERVQSALGLGGNSIMLLRGDGRVETLMGNDPPHGIDIAGIDSVNSELRFYSEQDAGMGRLNVYTYALRKGERGPIIRVLGYEAGRPETEAGWSQENPDGYKATYIEKEQARLDALGYGDKG